MRTLTTAEPSGSTHASDILRLRKKLRGDVIFASDHGYDHARRVWNGMLDKRPPAIVYCTAVDDVFETIAYARAQDLVVSVRAGGHNVAVSR